MIVIGADTHKRSYTFSALSAETGELRGSETMAATSAGHQQLLAWARRLEDERIWAIEDCRHVSGKLERFLLARGERVVRVPPKLMAGRRRASRQAGKSDPIDALAVARAALQEGIERLPLARLEGPAREVKLLLDHREDLICAPASRTVCAGFCTTAGRSSSCPQAALTGWSGWSASQDASHAAPRMQTCASCATRSAACASWCQRHAPCSES
jgi:hypothetical protein